LLLLAIVLIGSFLRTYLLGALSIWYDEMFSIVVAQNSLPGTVTAAATLDVHPPLYYVLLHYWILAFGESDVAVRLLSAIFGIFAIPMVYLVVLTLLRKLKWAANQSGAMPPTVSGLFYTLQVYAGTTLLLAVFLVLCGLLVAASVYPRRQAKKTRAEPVEKARLSAGVPLSLASYLCLVWLLTLNVVPFFISQRLPTIYYYRYAIAASVPLYLFVAKGVSIIRIRPLKLAAVGVIAFLAISAIYHVPIPEIQGTYVGIGVPKAPVREAVNYINKNAQSGDLIVFSPFWNRYFFFHYANRNVAILGLPTYNGESNAMTLKALTNATNAHKRIWLIEDDSPNYSELRLLAMENLTKAYRTSYNASYGTGFGRWQVYLFER